MTNFKGSSLLCSKRSCARQISSILDLYMQKAGLGFVIGTACCTSGYLSTCRFESAHEIRQGCMRVGQLTATILLCSQNAAVIVRNFSKYALCSGTFRLGCFFPRGEASRGLAPKTRLPCARRVHPPLGPGTHAKDPVFQQAARAAKGFSPYDSRVAAFGGGGFTKPELKPELAGPFTNRCLDVLSCRISRPAQHFEMDRTVSEGNATPALRRLLA
jgi:hypothetical protein